MLTTRARHEMRVFSSIRASDIDAGATATEGPRLLRDFLAYAEHRRLDSPTVSGAATTESPFERDVYNELTRRGVKVVPQVGSSGYRVDLGVLDDEVHCAAVRGLTIKQGLMALIVASHCRNVRRSGLIPRWRAISLRSCARPAAAAPS